MFVVVGDGVKSAAGRWTNEEADSAEGSDAVINSVGGGLMHSLPILAFSPGPLKISPLLPHAHRIMQ